MPRKNAMRDNVNAVRSRLPHLTDLSREQIELALLHYELNIDETVDAFNRNGAVEALNGWTEMNSHRGNNSSKRTNNNNNKARNSNNKPLTLPSNGVLRPSQRVSNIFQTFAEGGTPATTPTNEQYQLKQEISSENTPASSPVEDKNEISIITLNDISIEQPKPQRRKSVKSRNNSTTTPHNHEPAARSLPTSNKKLLTKSVKDLQRQTSTLTNVEILFNNEIKSSIKRIGDMFKQVQDILKEREIELYLEMDKVKEQGLNVIHRRQQRAIELRQRIDRCDRLEPSEIDNLRTDIKQFVTDRRYELGEELTSLHRFEYDQTLIESLKHFGHVLKIDRRSSITPASISIEHPISDVIPSSSNEIVSNDDNEVFHDPINVNHENVHSLPQTNGYLQYYDDTNNYQNMNRRRPQQYAQRPRPLLNYQNENNRRNIPKQTNGRVNNYHNNETINTYRRPRPPPQSIVA